MATYRDVNGTVFTDDDIERWATQAESETGYTGAHLGPSVPGRPVSQATTADPVLLRLDAPLQAKLNEAAQQRHITPSQLIRDLIDAL